MPLHRAINVDPIFDVDVFTIRFPMTPDFDKLVWAEVSHEALMARAIADGFGKERLDKRTLFTHYRTALEKAASEIYDRDGTELIRIMEL